MLAFSIDEELVIQAKLMESGKAAMKRGMTFGRSVVNIALLGAFWSFSAASVQAQYRTSGEDQRADLISRDLFNRIVPYRKVYNRPRFIGGWIAATIEPTSQEAMSWKEHHDRGSYWRHAPAYHPAYNYPKPWEVLPLGPRPASLKSTADANAEEVKGEAMPNAPAAMPDPAPAAAPEVKRSEFDEPPSPSNLPVAPPAPEAVKTSSRPSTIRLPDWLVK